MFCQHCMHLRQTLDTLLICILTLDKRILSYKIDVNFSNLQTIYYNNNNLPTLVVSTFVVSSSDRRLRSRATHTPTPPRARNCDCLDLLLTQQLLQGVPKLTPNCILCVFSVITNFFCQNLYNNIMIYYTFIA